jgi:23S rRNA pseudouridine1911/1915/1917 synthase
MVAVGRHPPGPPESMRLDVALIRRYPGLSRRKAREVIEKGQVSLAGHIVRAAGQRVEEAAAIHWDPNRRALPRARLSLPLLHEDEALLVVDKPAGLLTVQSAPGAEGEDTVLARVRDYVRHLRPRRPYVGVVHRIDRDTSGAVAFALSPAVREALRVLFRAHRIERRYLALVAGRPPADRGVVDLPLHHAYEGGKRRVARAGEPSRPALTRWTVTERFPGAALLEVELGTGRQHQIRVHLAHIGLPVLGDPVYGGGATPAPLAVARQMLHARLLAFDHPLGGQPVRAESAPPADFHKALLALRRAARGAGRASPK